MSYEAEEGSEESIAMTRQMLDKIFQEGTQYPVPNPFGMFTFEALQLLTEALFVFAEHGQRMGYDREVVDKIARLTNEAEKEEALRTLHPSINGPLFTEEDEAIVSILDHFTMEAMADLEAHEIAKEVIPDIEKFLKDQ